MTTNNPGASLSLVWHQSALPPDVVICIASLVPLVPRVRTLSRLNKQWRTLVYRSIDAILGDAVVSAPRVTAATLARLPSLTSLSLLSCDECLRLPTTLRHLEVGERARIGGPFPALTSLILHLQPNDDERDSHQVRREAEEAVHRRAFELRKTAEEKERMRREIQRCEEEERRRELERQQRLTTPQRRDREEDAKVAEVRRKQEAEAAKEAADQEEEDARRQEEEVARRQADRVARRRWDNAHPQADEAVHRQADRDTAGETKQGQAVSEAQRRLRIEGRVAKHPAVQESKEEAPPMSLFGDTLAASAGPHSATVLPQAEAKPELRRQEEVRGMLASTHTQHTYVRTTHRRTHNTHTHIQYLQHIHTHLLTTHIHTDVHTQLTLTH